MRYTPRQVDSAGNRVGSPGDPAGLLFDSLEPVAQGLGMVLVELTLSRHKSSVQIRAVVCRAGPSPENPGKVSGGAMGVNDCSRVHHALLPRLELAFPGQELYVEVSSPGIDRVIKDASEFVYYIGRGVRCYCTELSDWVEGAIRSADETQLILKGKDGMIKIAYETIAKAKLEYSLDYLREV